MASFLGPLLSALAYTLLIIFTGYFMRAYRVLNDAEAGGLSRFCGLLALPCALFASVVDLDWSSVDGTLLLGMFLSKVIIFAFTSLATLSRRRTPRDVARAGIFSIFTTKSNDIAFALPIVTAIFPERFARMVFLFVPLQLTIINPVGLMMMEYGSGDREDLGGGDKRTRASSLGTIASVFASTLMSPVMVAVMLGLLVNLTMKGQVPESITQYVAYCGQAYTSTALLTVGTSLSVSSKAAGKAPALDGVSSLVGVSLIVVKVFVAAMVMYHVCGALTGYDAVTANFAFVYGCMPPAPTVYVWARQYGVETELVGRMLVFSLLVATPFIIVTGVIIDLGTSRGDLASTLPLMDVALDSINTLGLLSSVWLTGVWFVSPRMRRGLRAELAPLVLCNAAVSVSALACVHTPPAPAIKLPLDVVRQLFEHLSATFATTLSLRLFRSLRMSPQRMRTEKGWWHALCVVVAIAVTALQLFDRSGRHWPEGDAREDFKCVFGLLHAKAPLARAVFLCIAIVLTTGPLLLFNVRYLRTALRMTAAADDGRGVAASTSPEEDVKYSISVVGVGGRSERSHERHARHRDWGVGGTPAQQPGRGPGEMRDARQEGSRAEALGSPFEAAFGRSQADQDGIQWPVPPSAQHDRVASDVLLSPPGREASGEDPAPAGDASPARGQGPLQQPHQVPGGAHLARMFEGGDETSLGSILQAVRESATELEQGRRDLSGLGHIGRDWTFEGRPAVPLSRRARARQGAHRSSGRDEESSLDGASHAIPLAEPIAELGACDVDHQDDDEEDEELEDEDGGAASSSGDSNTQGEHVAPAPADDLPWIEIRITRRRLPQGRGSEREIGHQVSSSLARAAAAIAEGSTTAAHDRAPFGSRAGDPMPWDPSLVPAGDLSAGLLGGGPNGDAQSAGGLLTRLQQPQPLLPPVPQWTESRSQGPHRPLPQHAAAAASWEATRMARPGSLNYIPMMHSLVWTNERLSGVDRSAHALELNETFNDSLRYLMVLVASIFSMVLGLSTALQDLATVQSLTALQEEIVLVMKLAFHGQVLVMVACFGFHPSLRADVRAATRPMRRRIRRILCPRMDMALATLRGTTSASGRTPQLTVFGRQYALAKARFE
mmetsp:Transcript_13272/g.40021  ORF Transcript_13272/g.40021 Transcript_13272/m.40021 type:complete len:1120 (-) Transcript_13272:249-3608(-)